MSREAQTRSIHRYLRKGNRLTGLQALELFDCFRLSARIYDLRKNGVNIVSDTMTKNGKNWAVYYINKPSLEA